MHYLLVGSRLLLYRQREIENLESYVVSPSNADSCFSVAGLLANSQAQDTTAEQEGDVASRSPSFALDPTRQVDPICMVPSSLLDYISASRMISKSGIDQTIRHTVLSREHNVERTTFLSPLVTMYVKVFVPVIDNTS